MWWAWPDGCIIVLRHLRLRCSVTLLRWRCPRTPWPSVRLQWAGQNMAAAASSSSWAEWAYCPACTDSSRAADGLWSPDTKSVSSQSSPSWWHLHRATASGNSTNISICNPVTAVLQESVVVLHPCGGFASIFGVLHLYLRVLQPFLEVLHFSVVVLL